MPAAPPSSRGEPRDLRTLFTESSATHLGLVRELMLECRLGEPSREWLGPVIAAVSSLKKSAMDLGLGELASVLERYLLVLEKARTEAQGSLDAAVRAELLEAYAGLVAAAPDAFGVEEEASRREAVIVSCLLRQLPEVRKVTLDRLQAAGFTRLEMYYRVEAAELATTAGIAPELAQKIVDHFQAYRLSRSKLGPEGQKSEERRQLRALVSRLRDQNAALDAASRSRCQADKRAVREQRNATWLELGLWLGRAGAVDLAVGLEKLPFQSRVTELERYLARSAGSQQPRGPRAEHG